MCGSKGGGSPPVPSGGSTAFQSTTTPSPFAQGLYTDFLNRANALSTTPFNPAMLGSVAPINAGQATAGNQLFNLGMSAGNFDPAQVSAIESPYIQDVVGATQNWFNNQNAIQANDLLSSAIRSGNAFGGDRAGVASGVLAGQQQLAQAPVIAGLYQSGYGQALQEYNQLKQMGLAGAGQALGWGSMLQQQQQRELDVAQQNAMMASAYPFQTLNWYGSILGGIAPLTGSQVLGYNTPPNPNSTSQLIGGISAGLGAAGALGGFAGPGQKDGGGFRRGGSIPRLERRAQGGLVPVLVGRRANGGLVAIPLQFGGSTDYSDDEDRSAAPKSDDEDRPSESKQESYSSSQDLTPPTEGHKQPSAPNFGMGQLKTSARALPQPTFPSGSGTTQPQQKSETEQWLDLGTKAIGTAAKLAPLLLLRRGGPIPHHLVRHLADAGDIDFEDESGFGGEPTGGPSDIGDTGETRSVSDEGPVPLPRARPNPPIPMSGPTGGRMTWFNPRPYSYTDPNTGQTWTDTGARGLREGPHASGLPIGTPGFATAGRGGLGHWYEVTTPDGQKQIIQKTDVGPPGVIDLNAAAASRAYPSGPGSVPSGRAQARYIGAQLPPDVKPTAPVQSDESGAKQPVDPDAAAARGEGDSSYTRSRLPPEVAAAMRGPEKTFAQRWASNPLTQFGASMLAQRSPYLGVNLGNAMLSTMGMQEKQRKQDILDAKPQVIETDKGQAYIMPDGSIFQTTLRSKGAAKSDLEEDIKRRQLALPEEIKTTKPGRFGTEETTSSQLVYDPKTRKMVPYQPPKQDVVEAPAEPPAEPPAPAPAPAPAARPAPAPAPAVTIAPNAVPTVVPRLQQDEAQSGQEAPAAPAGGRTGGAQLPMPTRVAQAEAPQQQPAQQEQAVEDSNSRIAKGFGQVTNPQALEQRRRPEAIASLTPQDQQAIKDMVDYRLDPYKEFKGQKNSKILQSAIDYARQYDPAYNPQEHALRAKAEAEFGISGQSRKTFESGNMVLKHINDTMTAADNLQNTVYPKWNYLTGRYEEETGGTKWQGALQAFRAKADTAATESAKLFRGAGALAEKEAALWRQVIADPYASPVTIRSALKALTGLVAERLSSTTDAYNRFYGPGYERNFTDFMGDKAIETISRANSITPEEGENKPFPPSKFGPEKIGGGPTEPKAPRQRIQNGVTFTEQPDGSWKPGGQ